MLSSLCDAFCEHGIYVCLKASLSAFMWEAVDSNSSSDTADVKQCTRVNCAAGGGEARSVITYIGIL
jgi:hypothetical protein